MEVTHTTSPTQRRRALSKKPLKNTSLLGVDSDLGGLPRRVLITTLKAYHLDDTVLGLGELTCLDHHATHTQDGESLVAGYSVHSCHQSWTTLRHSAMRE